MQTLFEAIGSA